MIKDRVQGYDARRLRQMGTCAQQAAGESRDRGAKRTTLSVGDVVTLAEAAVLYGHVMDAEKEQRERDDRARERERERTKAKLPEIDAEFDRWRWSLHLRGWGHDVPAFRRVRDALAAVRAQRHARNLNAGDYETEVVAVRVTADTFASQIAAADPVGLDPTTIAWVVAGLRCPAAPFCTGCPSCQTVTSPQRPNVEPRRVPGFA